jgi:hypothetical protein
MQVYPVKRTVQKALSEQYINGITTCFGSEPTVSDGHARIQYKALKTLDVSLGTDKKSIVVETESDTGVSDEDILDTNRRFRQYLDLVTGYTTKERVKLAKKAAEKTG